MKKTKKLRIKSIDKLLKMNPEERVEYLYHKAINSENRLKPVYEEFIKLNSKYAFWYAKNVINDKWSKAEPYILKDSDATKWYLEFLMDKYPNKIKITIDIIGKK